MGINELKKERDKLVMAGSKEKDPRIALSYYPAVKALDDQIFESKLPKTQILRLVKEKADQFKKERKLEMAQAQKDSNKSRRIQ